MLGQVMNLTVSMLQTVCTLGMTTWVPLGSIPLLNLVKLFSTMIVQRYQLGEWFNFVEATGRYMDEQSIRNTSVACEALAN